MGGNYGKQVLFLVEGFSRGEIRQMGMHRLQKRSVPLGTDRHHPTIGVDCNTVMNVVGRYKRDPVAAVTSFLEEWAHHRFVILPVVDGATPRAKQATLGHIAKRKINRAKAMGIRHQLRVVTCLPTQGTILNHQRSPLIGGQ